MNFGELVNYQVLDQVWNQIDNKVRDEVRQMNFGEPLREYVWGDPWDDVSGFVADFKRIPRSIWSTCWWQIRNQEEIIQFWLWIRSEIQNEFLT